LQAYTTKEVMVIVHSRVVLQELTTLANVELAAFNRIYTTDVKLLNQLIKKAELPIIGIAD
jgi:membrane carboxypeptidase/penicillin-binding protein